MNKFLFKSTDADFQKLILSQLEIVNRNVLYVTHMQDKILKLTQKLVIDKDLQLTVDKYFAEANEETSPQTDSDEQ